MSYDLDTLVHVSGCVTRIEYLNCESYRRAPPNGWDSVFDEVELDLAYHLKQNPWPPFGITRREAEWVIKGRKQ